MKDLTALVHHPQVSHDGFASLAVPTFRASTIVFDNAAAYRTRKTRGPDGYAYGLHGTPTTKTLEAQLTALEGGEHSLLLPSGQAAIAILFLTVLRPGDTVLIPDNIYPPARDLCVRLLAERCIRHRVYDPMIGAGIDALIDDTTRLVWTEAPGSATMEVADLPAIVAAAKARGILVGCDNSWATPVLFKPLAIGMDFVVEALTKYVVGHSDVLLGSISLKDRHWYDDLRDCAHSLGIGVSPDDCALALRGIETLGIRLAHIGRVSTDFAQRLQGHAAVSHVLHPAMPACPGHEFWLRDFRGSSGLFSVLIDPVAARGLDGALAQLRIFSIGASWGGTRSLVAPIAISPDRISPLWREGDQLLRISIGLEDPEELWMDLISMLDTLVGSGG